MVIGVILLYVIGFFADSILFGIGQFFESSSVTLLRPFDLSGPEMFEAMVGVDAMGILTSIAQGLGISLAIIILVFSLYKVFIGRTSNDTPDPFRTCFRFVISVILIYWGPYIIFTYLFPMFQSPIDRIFGLNNNAIIKASDIELWKTGVLGTGVNSIGDLASATLDAVFGPMVKLILLIVFLIAALVNMFKIIIENAERYFTLILLTYFAPLAASTYVSEKTMGIFKAYLQFVFSLVMTILFNILGLCLYFRVMSTVFNTISADPFGGKSIVLFIALIAFAKMVQKMDQILSQLMFKVNPIQNRSVLMGAFMGAAGIAKSMEGLSKTGSRVTGVAKGLKDKTSGFTSFSNKLGDEAKASGMSVGALAADKLVAGDFANDKEKGFLNKMTNDSEKKAAQGRLDAKNAEQKKQKDSQDLSNINKATELSKKAGSAKEQALSEISNLQSAAENASAYYGADSPEATQAWGKYENALNETGSDVATLSNIETTAKANASQIYQNASPEVQTKVQEQRQGNPQENLINKYNKR